MASTKESIQRRANRVRRQVKAAANGRPRLSVFRSSKNIYVQVIDDVAGRTIAAASTMDKDLRGKLKTGADTAAAAEVGKLIAERASKAGVSEVVFDRVLLTGGDAGIAVGRPVVDGVSVRAKVVAERKEAKIIVFKKKRRKRMRRKQGHRQRMTEVEVVSIG